MTSPTQHAEVLFRTAYDRALGAAAHTQDVQDPTGIAVYDIAASLAGLSKGLGELAVGLRATYMLLERVERKLNEPQLPTRNPLTAR